MSDVNALRIFERVSGTPASAGGYVLYWMQINRRLHYNYALDYAVSRANNLGKPLVIYEGVRVDYPWASERTHHFLLDGMAEHRKILEDRGITYFPFLETYPGQGKGLLKQLGNHAALVVSDEYPAYIMPEQNAALARKLRVPFVTVDSNGILPLALSEKAPTSAYNYRRLMQRQFVQCFSKPPHSDPLSLLQTAELAAIPGEITSQWPPADRELRNRSAFISGLPLNHTIGKVAAEGSRSAARERMLTFVHQELPNYDKLRNHPDEEQTSGLSPWLHFGKISSFEVVKEVLDCMPDGWRLEELQEQKGKRDGFFNADASTEGFLDEIITWRETGFHFCHHVPEYDKFETLPEWAQATLNEHAGDQRPYLYSYEELAEARTHDPVWNAAQQQLRTEGRIHNYLRMLWGKKVLEWTPDPHTALQYLIDLNNWYAIDGRDPNSYSGIFWIFGRFDRAWGPERRVFGKIRYMTSKSARSKIRLKQYLSRHNGSE